MPTEAVFIKIADQAGLAAAMEQAAADLEAAGSELVLDFSSVDRIDSGGLLAMEKLLHASEDKSVKVTLHGANVGVYKVLKLMKFTQRVGFTN